MIFGRRYEVLALLLFFLLAPFHNWTLFRVAGLPLVRPDLLAVLLVLMVGVISVITRRRVKLNRVNLLVVSLLGVVTVSSLSAVMRATTPTAPVGTMLAQFVILVLLFVIIPNLVRTADDVIFVVRGWLYSATAISLFGIYQGFARLLSLPFAVLVFNIPEPETVQRIGYTELFSPFFRVGSVFPEPAWYGGYLVPPAVVCFSLLVYNPDGVVFRNRKMTAIIWGLLLIGIIQSGSLLAYMTLFLTLGSFTIPLALFRGRLRTGHLTASAALAVPFVLLFGSVRRAIRRVICLVLEVGTVFTSGNLRIDVGSAQYRLRIARSVVETWSDGTPVQLLFGYGLHGITRSPAVRYSAASSSYIQMLFDTGIVGLTLFVAVIVQLGLATYRYSNVSTLSEEARMLSMAFTGGVIATGILFLQIGYIPPVRWLGALTALCFVSVAWSNLAPE